MSIVGWQPIETAPKDGTKIDLWMIAGDGYNEGRVTDAYWVEASRDYEYAFDGHKAVSCWWAPNQWYDGADGPMRNDVASHWMPLPDAPK